MLRMRGFFGGARMGDGDSGGGLEQVRARASDAQDRGDWATAAAAWSELWRLNPDDDAVLDAAATSLVRSGNVQAAITFLEQAVAIRGAQPSVLRVLGRVASDLRLAELAVDLFTMWVRKEPHRPEPFVHLARAMGDAGRLDDAVGLLQEVIPEHSSVAQLWTVLGTLVSNRDGFEAALPFFEEATRLAPERASVWSNLGRALEHLGLMDQAVEASVRAVELQPSNAMARMGLGLLRLGKGDFHQGWRDYRARLDPTAPDYWTSDFGTAARPDVWDGGDVSGRSILVIAEQGLGDEVLFGRACRPLVAQAGQVTLAVEPRLVMPFSRSFPTARVIAHETERRGTAVIRRFPELVEGPSPELVAPLGAVAERWWTSVAGVERCEGAYLVPDPAAVERWERALADLGEGLKVGLAWRSGLMNHGRSRHYARIEDFVPLLSEPNIVGINAQYGDCSEELATLEAGLIHDFDSVDLKHDIDECLALFSALDLVISPFSSTFQLAAAVGTPCWTFGYVRPWWMFGQAGAPWSSRTRVHLAGLGSGYAPMVSRMVENLRRGGRESLAQGGCDDYRNTSFELTEP